VPGCARHCETDFEAEAAGCRCRHPVIYVNDNRGRWRSDFAALVRESLAQGSRGSAIARLLAPDPASYAS
jgi:hypothetical protein